MKPTKRDRALAARTQDFCHEHDLSQKVAAAKCDISQQDFNKLLNLKKCFTLPLIQKIMNGLQCFSLISDLDLVTDDMKLNEDMLQKLKDIEDTFRLVHMHHDNDIQLFQAKQALEILRLEQLINMLTQSINDLRHNSKAGKSGI